jgi:very-short-patch-repair endonuclease
MRVRGIPTEGTEAARRLRRESTPAEQVLWEAVPGRQLDGLKFRRQYAIGPYVLDFSCVEHRLVVELDGSVHDVADRAAYDAGRTEDLAAYGYRVLRFRNDAVFADLASILDTVRRAAAPPLPGLGEGAGG